MIEIKVEYSYYSGKRITPVFLNEEDLVNLEYSEFVTRIVSEVPHLRKLNNLRVTVKDETIEEVDLSQKYFKLQIRGLLEKGAKSIKLRVFEFDSPAVDPASRVHNMAFTAGTEEREPLTRTHARRTLILPGQNVCGDKRSETNTPVLLPLQRYAKKQQDAVSEIRNQVQAKRQELMKIDDRIKRASEENSGHSTACGNCHLKLGHTRKICTFSPCKSAYSCGFLSKHTSEKSERSNLEKEINRLDGKLRTAVSDLDNASRAADKIASSASRRIEDVVVSEMPDRYTSNGLRNWVLLNKDVAVVQRNLKGKLPSRENVKKLLDNIVMKGTTHTTTSSSTSFTDTSNYMYCDVRKQTDHRMSSQKRLLSEEYAIRFPTEKKSCVAMCAQEEIDFKLALKLQQEEMNSPSDCEVLSPCSELITSAQGSQLEPADVNSSNSAASAMSECVGEPTELEFQANAAAALLELQRRSSCQK